MKVKSGILLSLLGLIFSIQIASNSYAKSDIPAKPDNFYLDQLDFLDSSTKENIEKTNLELEEKTGSQVVLVTLKDLKGRDPFDLGVEIFNSWKIGDEKKDNGVLILLSKDEESKKNYINIITGYGIEGRLNDGKVGRIIDTLMMDDLKEGYYSRALNEGFKAVVNEIALEYGVELTGDYSKYNKEKNEENSFFLIILFYLIIFFMIVKMKNPPRGPRYRRRRPYYYPRSYGGFFGSGYGGGFGGSSSSGGFTGGGGSSGGGGAGREF